MNNTNLKLLDTILMIKFNLYKNSKVISINYNMEQLKSVLEEPIT